MCITAFQRAKVNCSIFYIQLRGDTVTSDAEQKTTDITFVTIDAAENDLPWQFTALSVPTILFFPAVKNLNNETTFLDRSDTRVFPANKPLTVTNLLNFILVNLPHSSRTHLVLNLCDDRCRENSRTVIKKQLESTAIDNELDENYHRTLYRLNYLSSILLSRQKSEKSRLIKDKHWTTRHSEKDEL